LSLTLVSKPEPVRRRSVALLLAVVIAIYIGSAARPGLLDDADGCHALAAHEMLQRNNWTVLYINGIRWLEKPPLHYWLVAAAYALIGESAFATRLPIALAMVCLVLLLYEFGRRFFSERAGFYAGLVMGTSAGAFLFTRIMIPEALYALEFTAAFYLFMRAWTGSLSPRVGYWGCAAVVGLATLTRAGIGAFFPLVILAAFLVAAGAWRRSGEARRRLSTVPLWSSTAIALAVALPWHVAAALRTHGFLWFYFVNEQILRALGKRYPPDYTAVPLWMWWGAHLIWFFPWIAFLPYVWGERPALKSWGRPSDTGAQARLLAFIWAAVIFVFFSFVTGSRMEYYAFGAWPAVALLIGLGLERAEAARDRWLPRLHAGLAAIGLACAVILLALLWMSRDISHATDITTLLSRHETDFYRVSMATLFDLTPQAFARLRTPALIAAAALTFGLGFAWWVARRRSASAAAIAVAVTMAVFCFAANEAFNAFEPRLSSRPLAAAVQGLFTPRDRLVVYGEFEQACSFSFYIRQPAWIYNGRYNGLEFGSHFADAPQIFLDDGQFVALWQSAEAVFLFVPPEQRDAALSRLPRESVFLVAENGSKRLYANRPVGSALVRGSFHDFITP
jgi:4-amino-4-deoxy-L-arabinose transferase-like glycosyltransferase